MKDTVFIDTSILVYVYDGRDQGKQSLALETLESVGIRGVISTQVVAEFCNVMLGGRGVTMRPDDLQTVVTDVLAPRVQHTPDTEFYIRAIMLQQRYQLSFYDSLIVQAALDLGCTTLYSEDLQAGAVYGMLTVVNPFAEH